MSEIKLERTGNVASVALAAPERRNALLPGMVLELLDVCSTLDNDESVGAVVLMAEGKSFCAGAHRELLDQVGRDPVTPQNYRDIGLIYSAFVRIGALRAPTIAAVRGHAIGAGMNLMLAADLRIVASSARIGSGFVGAGLHPGGGHFALLARTAGREVAAGVGLFGDEISGARAVDIGLAWEALPEAEVEPRALELATRIAAYPDLARAMVRSFRLETGPPGLSWEVGLETERAVQLWSLKRRTLASSNNSVLQMKGLPDSTAKD